MADQTGFGMKNEVDVLFSGETVEISHSFYQKFFHPRCGTVVPAYEKMRSGLSYLYTLIVNSIQLVQCCVNLTKANLESC